MYLHNYVKSYGLCRYSGYCQNGAQLQELKIELPLSSTSFKDLLTAEKVGLANNFISAFIAHAGSVVVFHSDTIKEIQDDCPIILCYSKYSGTGTTFDFSKHVASYITIIKPQELPNIN